jgi:hypothetical protein
MYRGHFPERVPKLTETREHPVEQLRRREERRGLSDSVGKRGVKKHGEEVQVVAVVCRVMVLMGTLGAGKDDNE